MKEFNLYGENDETEYSFEEMERSRNYATKGHLVECQLNSPHGRGHLSKLHSVELEFFVHADPTDSGMCGVKIKLEGNDRTGQVLDLDEVDPVDIFWMGIAFLKIAAHYGICKEVDGKKIYNKSNYAKETKEDSNTEAHEYAREERR